MRNTMFYLKNKDDFDDFEDFEELTEEDILDILQLDDSLKPIDISWEEFFEDWDLDFND